jgi:hypothetical protein
MLLFAVLLEEWEEKDEQLVSDEIEDEDRIGTNLSMAVWWLIQFLGDRHPDKFIKVASAIGMPIR